MGRPAQAVRDPASPASASSRQPHPSADSSGETKEETQSSAPQHKELATDVVDVSREEYSTPNASETEEETRSAPQQTVLTANLLEVPRKESSTPTTPTAPSPSARKTVTFGLYTNFSRAHDVVWKKYEAMLDETG